MPQPDLVLLLVWLREKANTNARAANGDTHSANSDCDLDAHLTGYEHGHTKFHRYLDAHLTGYEHSHTKFHRHLDTHLSGYGHGHSAALAEQLTDNIPERNASHGRVFARPEAGVCFVVVKVAM